MVPGGSSWQLTGDLPASISFWKIAPRNKTGMCFREKWRSGIKGCRRRRSPKNCTSQKTKISPWTRFATVKFSTYLFQESGYRQKYFPCRGSESSIRCFRPQGPRGKKTGFWILTNSPRGLKLKCFAEPEPESWILFYHWSGMKKFGSGSAILFC